MDPNLVVVLDAVLAERNLTRAGERLGMTQPAVSAALARLRRQFDDALLVRTGRVFELTPTARRLRPAVDRAMAEIRRTLDVPPSFDPATTTRTFYVSGSDYPLAELAGPLQALLGEQAPHARLSFDSLPTGSEVSPVDLLCRDVFVAGAGSGLPGKRRSLFLDRLVCVVAAGHPRLRPDGVLSSADLAQARHVRSVLGAAMTTHVDDLLAAAGIEPRVAITVEGFLPVPFMIAGSDLVGFVPERVALRYAGVLGLRVVETPIAPITLVEAAYWHPSRNDDPALGWLVAMLLRASEIVEFGALQPA
ncbi:LysR family transcriptional regulator [Nocardioides sp.]|uniref:LysR family transcriptional regulator n=1 Tax=Nocardioides sp. TaxID=35761 RepID=UPI0039E58431